MQADVRAPALRIDALCAAILLVAGTTLCMHVFCSGKWGAQPRTQDEYVYLFQAKTLASGHLTMPSPPLPEFFEAAHILVVPRFAAKYLPGHAAVLAPFLLAGIPWLAPCLLLGATAALLYLAGRAAKLEPWAAAIAPVLLLGNADVFPFYASYLSQSSSVTAVAAVVAAAVATAARPSRARIVLLFVFVGAAGLVRPFAGVASAVAGVAVLVRLRRTVPARTLLWGVVPLAAAALLTGGVCKATTGSWTTAPWALYARQYMPYDGPGIGAVHAPPSERELPAHLDDLQVGFRQSRARHTFARLPSDLLYRARLVADLLPGFAVLPFVLAGVFWAPLWPAGVLAAAFFALQLTFHMRGPVYYLEMVPWLYLAAAAGAQLALRAALRARRSIAIAACAALSLPALYTAVHMTTELRPVIAFASERDWPFARWARAFAWLADQHAIVFIRYPERWDGNVDLTYNDPDLSRAPLIRALDKGERDAELLRYFPGRPAYRLDALTLRAERLR